jgi:hypothetical protein
MRGDGLGRVRREFLDFMIDGVPLRTAVREQGGTPGDEMSVLATDLSAEYLGLAVRRLLGQASADFGDGRLALYVCPECGDLGCGALSAVVERVGDDVVWRDFGWQDTVEPDVYFEDFTGTKSVRFDRAQYEGILTSWLPATVKARLKTTPRNPRVARLGRLRR